MIRSWKRVKINLWSSSWKNHPKCHRRYRLKITRFWSASCSIVVSWAILLKIWSTCRSTLKIRSNLPFCCIGMSTRSSSCWGAIRSIPLIWRTGRSLRNARSMRALWSHLNSTKKGIAKNTSSIWRKLMLQWFSKWVEISLALPQMIPLPQIRTHRSWPSLKT